MTVVMSLREQMYNRLPEAWQYDDERLGRPLWAWLYYVLTDAEAVCQTINRYAGGELVDPALALTSELEWLAWISGIPFPDFLSDTADVRTWLARPERLERGSHRSMAQVVFYQLGGGVSGGIYNDGVYNDGVYDGAGGGTPPTSEVYGHWRGNPWIVVIRTADEQTPDTGEVVTTWNDLRTIAPTWSDLEESGTDDDLHLEDYIRVTIANDWAASEKTAGTLVAHRWIAQWAPLVSDSFYREGPVFSG